ncbi:MAG: choice-of-anchor M domain-containing protein [Acidimicrobiia bacterium]
METRPLSRALGASLAAAVGAATLATLTAVPAGAAVETVSSEEVTYTFVVGELGDPGDKLVLDVGHTDAVAPVFEGDEIVIRTKDDTDIYDPEIVFRDPADLIFQVKPEAEVAVPDNPNFTFLGAPGDPVWILPQTQNPALVWPGWSTEHGSLAGQFSTLQFAITDVSGPGRFDLYQTGAFGSVNRIASSDGSLANAWTVNVPQHVHASWAFSQPGTYEITFQVTGDWLNAPEPDPDPIETDLSIAGVADHYHPGDTVTLTAVQDPPTGEDHYHWFVKPAGAEEFAIVAEASGGTYSFTATEDHDGAQYVVKLYDHDHAVIAESPPVSIHVEDHGEEPEPPELSQTIVATLDEEAGALIVSVDPADREVVMSPFELSSDGERWESTGDLRPVRVADTRSGRPGWNVSGQSGAFTSGGASVGAEHLGWTPAVVSQSDGQGATAGDAVAPGSSAGEGLSVSRPLASAPSGSGFGTADLGGGLELHVPTSTDPGTYTAVLTLTAV